MVLFHWVALIIWGLSTLVAFQLITTGWYGAILGVEAWQYKKPPDSIKLARHVRASKLLLRILAIAILAIEGARVILKLPYIRFFGVVHLPLLVLFAIFLSFGFDFRILNNSNIM